jgi:sulfate permease, SulP family
MTVTSAETPAELPDTRKPTGRLRISVPIAAALRRVLAKGYGLADLRADLMAGTVVGVVALPLSMALAIAVGAPPQHGLSGLMTAGMMAGVILVLMGVTRLGRFLQYIPHPVTTGFTAGIATVIATLQVKDALGLQLRAMPDRYTGKLAALWGARGSAHLSELLVAGATLALLLAIPRVIKRVPAPLIAIGVVSLCATLGHKLAPGFSVATIGSRFHTSVGGVDVAGIPAILPAPSLPWGHGLSLDLLSDLLPAAFAIAMLGAIESLLSAVIADGMTGTRHDPNAGLVGLGIGNILAPIFGGIAATGALARTATNVRAGARSPFAAVAMASIHAARGDGYRVMIVHLGRVPVIDSTGLVALDNAIGTLCRAKKVVVLAGPLPRPRTVFDKARLEDKHPGLRMADSLESAIRLAGELANPQGQAPDLPAVSPAI